MPCPLLIGGVLVQGHLPPVVAAHVVAADERGVLGRILPVGDYPVRDDRGVGARVAHPEVVEAERAPRLAAHGAHDGIPVGEHHAVREEHDDVVVEDASVEVGSGRAVSG